MEKFTIREFREAYPSDAACLDKLFMLRYGNLTHCPGCAQETKFRRITTRRCYQCRKCYAQFYPTAGTVFNKTRTPLRDWFYIIYLFSTTRNGVAAKEIERQIGVTYKCAFRMGHQIRQLLSTIPTEKLKGIIEIDETYVGGIAENSMGRTVGEKTPVVGMVERTGNVRAFKVNDSTKASIYPLINEHIDRESKINTDQYVTYHALKDSGFPNHKTVNHSLKQYRIDDISTNTIEGYFSQLKRMIGGTHIHVSDKYIQNYINESCFRYNNRYTTFQMFNVMINQIKQKFE